MPDYNDILKNHATPQPTNIPTDPPKGGTTEPVVSGLEDDSTTTNEVEEITSETLNDILQKHSNNKTSLKQGNQTDIKITDYEPYIPGFNPNDLVSELDKARADNQSNWEKTYNMGKQMVGEIVGGAVSGVGSIFELPIALSDELNGESADFNNFLIEWGEGIKEYAKENGQIYRSNPSVAFDVTDFGWWAENGVSLASTVGLMIPATGTIKGLGLISDVLKLTDKVGDSTKYWSKLVGSAAIMRNAENMTESLSVANKSRKYSLKMFEDESKFEQIANGELGEELKANGKLVNKENLADLISAKAGWRSYKVNSANIVFDMVQMAPLFKGFKAGTRTNKNISSKVDDAIKGHGLDSFGKVTRIKKVKRFFNPILSPVARQATEGIEEGINFIGGAEGEYYGKTLAGDTETNFESRLGEYLTDGHFYESAAWGVAGGVAFDGATGLLKRTQGYKDETDNNKVREIEQRKQVVDSYKKAHQAVVNDEELTPTQKREHIEQLQDEMATDLAMRASAVGNVDILLNQVEDSNFKESLIESGLADKEDADYKALKIKDTILETEKLYNQYYNKFFVGNEAQQVKNHLITESIKNERAISRLSSQNNVMKDLVSSKKNRDVAYQNNLENGINEALEITALESSIELLKDSPLKNRVPNLTRRLNSTKEKYKGTLKFNPSDTGFLNDINDEILENLVEQTLIEEAMLAHSEKLNEIKSKKYKDKLNSDYLKQVEKEQKEFKAEKAKEKANKEKKDIVQKAKDFKDKVVNKAKDVVGKKEKTVEETTEETTEKEEETKPTNETKEEFEYPNDPKVYNAEKYKEDEEFQKILNGDENIDNWLEIYSPDSPLVDKRDEHKFKTLQNYKAELDNNIKNSIFGLNETDTKTAVDNYSKEEAFYTNDSNKKVQDEHNTIDDNLETSVNDKDYDEDNKFIKRDEGDLRVVNGHNILAYLSRGYENIITTANDGTETLSKEDIDDALNDDLLDKNILNPNEYQIGDELTVGVDRDYIKQNDNGTTTTFNSLQADETTKNSLIPIAIYKNGKKVAHLHDINWINETNVAGDVKAQKKKLQEIRNYLAEQKEPTTIKITNRNHGKLARTKDNRQIDTIIAFPDKKLQFGVGKNNKLFKNKENEVSQNTLNKSFNEGAVYAIAQISKDKHIGLPLQRKKVPTHIARSITKAVQLHLENDPKSKEVNDLNDEYGYNILSIDGIKKYINNFINVYHLDDNVTLKDKLNTLTSDVHLLTVSVDSIKFGRGKGIGFTSLSKENTPKELRKELLDKLQEHLESTFVDFDMSKLNSGETKMPLLTETEDLAELSYDNYNDFVKSFTTTNLLSFDLGNGNFGYTVQPVIETNVGSVVNSKPKVTTSENKQEDNNQSEVEKINKRREEKLLGGFKVKDTRKNDKEGNKRTTVVKVNKDGTKISFEGKIENNPNKGLNASYPKMKLEDFLQSEFYKNLKENDKENLDELLKGLEEVTIELNEIRVSKSEADIIGKGNSGVTITIISKDGKLNDINLASNTSTINAKYDAKIDALSIEPIEQPSTTTKVNNINITSSNITKLKVTGKVGNKVVLEAKFDDNGKLLTTGKTMGADRLQTAIDSILNGVSLTNQSKALVKTLKDDLAINLEFELEIEIEPTEQLPSDDDMLGGEFGNFSIGENSNKNTVISRYYNKDVKQSPNKIFIFGDNLDRKGTGGQAQIRNNENAFGIATKKHPTNNSNAFMSDSEFDENVKTIKSDIVKIKNDGRDIVFPKDGFGTGLAKLKEKAPKTYQFLKEELIKEFGFDNDTGVLNNKPTKQLDLFKTNDKKTTVKPTINYNNLQKEIEESVLIKGFTASSQDIITSAIAYDINEQVINEGKLKQKDVFANWLIYFTEQRNKFDTGSNPKTVAEFNKIIDNFDKVKLHTLKKVGKINGISIKEDITVDELQDLETNFEKTNFNDEATLQLDAKDTVSVKLKRFFSGINKLKADGSIATPYMGLKAYVPFDTVFNEVSAILSNTKADYNTMLKVLEQYKEAKPYLQSLINKLNTSDQQTKNEFTVAMSKHKVNMVYLLWTKDRKTGAYNMITKASNQNDLASSILSSWNEGLKSSNLVSLNDEKQLSLNSNVDAIITKLSNFEETEPTIEELGDFLKSIGIEMNPKSLKDLKNEGLRSKGQTIEYKDLFKVSNGAFKILKDNLIKTKESNIEDNNPFKSTVFKSLAILDAKYNTTAFSNSFKNGEGNSIYSFSNNKYFIDRVREIKDNKQLQEQLGNLSYNSGSTWLKQLADEDNNLFKRTFDYFYLDSLVELGSGQKGKKLSNMSDAEHEIAKLGLFWNRNINVDGKRIVKMFYPTMSDKTTMVGFTTVAEEVSLRLNGEISKQTIETVYNSLVAPEIARAINTKETGIKGYDKGSSMVFSIPELNNNELLYPNGVLNTNALAQADVLNSVKEDIKNHLETLVTKKLEYWNEVGINKDAFIDEGYKKYATAKSPSEKDMLRFAATDFVVNTLITNQNAFQLLIGDPALFYKSKSKDSIQQVKDTFENIGKRLASQIAPGLDLANSENNSYKQGFIQDYVSDSKYLDAYSKYLSKEDLAEYKGIEGTDAQEFTTVAEHLYVMKQLGKLTDEEVKSIEAKAEANTLSPDELGLIFQPMKPVYTGQYMDIDNDVQRMMYIKSSSFPLVPQLTKGLEIDKLRKAMEHPDTGVDRVSFSTANKVGDFTNPTQVFDDNGNVVDNLVITKSLKLDRKGFRIQQEIPYKESKDKVNDGSQQRKLLFANILDVPGVRKSKAKYDEIYNKLYKNDYDALINELDIQPDGSFNRVKLQKVLVEEAESRNYSINDIQSLKIDENGRFIYPLAFNNSASKFEALLTSIVDNRVRKKKFRGNSFVLGTEEGFKTANSIEEANVSESSIVYTPNWTGELKPQRPETVTTSVLYTKDTIDVAISHINSLQAETQYKLTEQESSVLFDYKNGLKNGKQVLSIINTKLADKLETASETVIKPAQILIPFKFRDNKGKLLNAKDFVDESGRLDLSLLDESILESFGFRIPTQGLNSMSYMEVVGFLPQSTGDLLIAPREFTIQMGSDFDVDKLYSYMYNTVQYNGKLRVINDNLINDIVKEFDVQSLEELQAELQSENLQEILKEYNKQLQKDKKDFNEADLTDEELDSLYDKIELSKELKAITKNELSTLNTINEILNPKYKLQNELLDTHFEILKNTDKRVQSQILEPLGFGTLKDDAKTISKFNKIEIGFSPLSDAYQKMKYINATAGKAGVGVFSMDSVFNALLQDKDIDILDDKGKPYKVTFGEAKSNKLSDVKAVKENADEPTRYKSQVIAAYQSAAVDNEKEQILDKLNINSNTFDVIAILNQMGFRENVVTTFINQPIIKDYVIETIKAGDITSEVTSNVEDYVYNKLKEKYKSTNYSNDLHGVLADKGVNSMLSTIKDYENTISKNNIQLAMLDKFLTLKSKGKELKEIQSAINSDSSGIDSSLIETQSKQQSVADLFTTKKFSNVDKLIGEYSKEPKEGYTKFADFYVKPTTINGNVAVYGLQMNNLLWSNEFHYHKAKVNRIFDEITRITGKSDSKANQKNKLKKEIWGNMKSYLFTSQSSNLYDKDIKQLRQELLFDTEGNKSLASIIHDLRNHGIQSNAFINKLSTDIQKGQKPSLVTFNANTSENFDEANIYAAFVELLVNDRPIGDTSTRQIAEKLIQYQFLTGGLQQAKQFIKYIPVAYLNEIGFSEYLNTSINGLETNFTRQFIQNNAGKVPRVTKKELKLESNDKVEVIKLENFDNRFTDNKGNPLPYISMYNKKSESGYDLYEFDGSNYNKISTLGNSDFSEYDVDALYLESTIKSNKGVKLNRPTTEYTKIEETESSLSNYGIDSSIENTQRTRNFLSSVIRKSNNKLYVALAKQMSANLDKINTPIIINENFNAEGMHYNNVITINPNKLQTNKDVERVVLHELIHAFTSKGLEGKSRATLRLKGIFNEYKDSLSEVELKRVLEILDRVKKGSNETLTYKEMTEIYAGVNVEEFVAVLFESKELQDILKTSNFNKDKNFLQEILDRILAVLETLGFKKGTDLHTAIYDVFDLIENTEADIVSNEGNYSPDNIAAIELQLKLNITDQFGKTKTYDSSDAKYISELKKEYNSKLPSGFTIGELEKDGKVVLYVQPVKGNYSVGDNGDPSKGREGKFGKLIKETDKRINNIKNNIATAKSNKNYEAIIQLEERLKDVESDLDVLIDSSKLEDIQFYAEKDLTRIKELIENDNLDYQQLEEAQRLIHIWQKGVDLFFEPIEKTSEILVDEFDRYRAKADRFNDVLISKQKKLARSLVAKLTGKDISVEEMFKEYQDVNALTSNVLDISHADNLLLQAVWKGVKLANNDARLETEVIAKNVDTLIEKAESSLGKGDKKYDIFRQLTKNGEWTGDLVHRYSKDYFDTKTRQLRKAEKVNTKGSWNTYYKWKKENELIFDVRKLFPDSNLYKSNFNEEHKTKHIDELKSILGEKGYNQMYEKAKKQVQNFKDLKEVQEGEIALKDLTQKEKDLQLLIWEKENSPYYASETFGTGKSLIVDGKFVKTRGFEHTTVIPKKENFYDSNFQQIENNEDLNNLYNFMIDTFGTMSTLIPDNQKSRIRENTLPEIKKSITSLFAQGDIRGGVSSWYNKLMEDISVNELSETSYVETDAITGEEERKLKVQYLANNSEKAKELRKRANIEFELDNNRKPNEEEKQQIRDNIYKALLKDKSFDLAVVLKAYSASVLAYKHKARVEPQLKLATSILNSIQETKFNAQGKKMKEGNKLARKAVSESYVHTKNMYNYYKESFYGVGKKLEGVSTEKRHTPEQKVEKKKLEELIAKNEENNEAKDYNKNKVELQAQLDKLGSSKVMSKRGDKILQYVQLKGMSYNVLSGFANMMFGLVDNLTTGSDGRLYNNKEYYKGLQMVMKSSFSRLAKQSDESKKIANLMQYLDVLKDSSNELFESSSKSTLHKKMKFLQPYEVQKRTEYINQAPIMIAMLNTEKVEGTDMTMWEAMNIDGAVKEGVNLTKEQLDNFKVKLDQTIKMNHGNYDTDSAIMGKATITGRALMQFRTWMFESFHKRFGAEKFDSNLGITRKGRYRTLYSVGSRTTIWENKLFVAKQLLKKMTFNKAFANEKFEDIFEHEVDAANMRAVFSEILVYMSLMGMMMLMKMGDDDDEKSFTGNLLMNQMLRLQTDMEFYVNPVAFETLTKNSIPAMALVTDIGQWSKAVIGFTIGEDEIVSGVNSGDSKLLRETSQMLPLGTQVYRVYNSGKQLFDK